MLTKILPLIALSSIAVVSAHAADIPTRAATPAYSAASMMRLYGGVEVGGGFADYDAKNLNGASVSKSGGSFAGGVLVGAEFGDRLKYGIEAAFNIHESRKRVGALSALDHVQDLLWSSRLVGRVSHPFGQYTPFAFAGVNVGEAHVHRSPDYVGVGDVVMGRGPTAGVGVEYAIMPHTLARIAYHYEQYNFDRAWAGTRVISADHTAHMLRVALIRDFTGGARTTAASAAHQPWAGFYAGGSVSGALSQVETKDSNTRIGQSFDAVNVGVGVFGGYNFAWNNIVFGPDFTLEKQFGRGQKAAGALPAMAYDSMWAAAARARVGYAIGNVLPYVAGGIAYSQFKQGMNQQSLTPVAGNWAAVEPGHGAQVGVGVDYKFAQNLFVRAEYNATLMAQRSIHLNDKPYTTQPVSHTAVVGVGVTF